MLRCVSLFVLCWYAFAQTGSSPAGKWVSNLKFFGNDNYDRLKLDLTGAKLTGKLGDDPFEGTFENGRIEGTVKPGPKRTIKLSGSLQGDRIEGTAVLVEDKLDLKWEAYREAPRVRPRRKLRRSSQRSLSTTSQMLFHRFFISLPATL